MTGAPVPQSALSDTPHPQRNVWLTSQDFRAESAPLRPQR